MTIYQMTLFPVDGGVTEDIPSSPCLPVNGKRSTLTPEERRARKREQRKRRYHANREKCLQQKRLDYIKHKEERLAKCKIYHAAHKEHHNARCRQYQRENKERLSERSKQYYREHSEHLMAYRREYKRKNWSVILAKQNAARKRMLKDDQKFAILTRLRSRMAQAVRKAIGKKHTSTMKLVGCNPEDLLRHIESQFTDGMTWENRNLWHIDHIRPCASFDLTDPQQQKACFHYTNLQPLWAFDNKAKGDKWNPTPSTSPAQLSGELVP